MAREAPPGGRGTCNPTRPCRQVCERGGWPDSGAPPDPPTLPRCRLPTVTETLAPLRRERQDRRWLEGAVLSCAWISRPSSSNGQPDPRSRWRILLLWRARGPGWRGCASPLEVRPSAEDLLELVMRRYGRASTLLTSNRHLEDASARGEGCGATPPPLDALPPP